MNATAQLSFASISPTAQGVAYLRAQSGIPYTKEIAEVTHAREATALLAGGEEHLPAMTRLFAAWAELRFKALSKAVDRYEHKSVFELAAGLSPRGLIYGERPDVLYLSTDLDEMQKLRMDLFARVGRGTTRSNLWYGMVDATNRRDIVDKKHFFRTRGNVAVINEGLLAYMTHEQKLMIARNICELLQATGGAWYTSDIHTVAELERIELLSAAYLHNFEKKTGRSFKGNAFTDLDEAQELMQQAGLRVSRFDQSNFIPLGKLHSSIPGLDVEEMLIEQHLWRMTPA